MKDRDFRIVFRIVYSNKFLNIFLIVYSIPLAIKEGAQHTAVSSEDYHENNLKKIVAIRGGGGRVCSYSCVAEK